MTNPMNEDHGKHEETIYDEIKHAVFRGSEGLGQASYIMGQLDALLRSHTQQARIEELSRVIHRLTVGLPELMDMGSFDKAAALKELRTYLEFRLESLRKSLTS